MDRFLAKFCKALVVALMALSISGGHLGIAQPCAWGTMLVDRSADRSLSDAIESTFSGHEPCSLCLAIEEANEAESQESSRISDYEIRLLVLCCDKDARIVVVPPDRCHLGMCWTAIEEGSLCSRIPDVPPPRYST